MRLDKLRQIWQPDRDSKILWLHNSDSKENKQGCTLWYNECGLCRLPPSLEVFKRNLETWFGVGLGSAGLSIGLDHLRSVSNLNGSMILWYCKHCPFKTTTWHNFHLAAEDSWASTATGLQFGNEPVEVVPSLIRLRREVSVLDEVALTSSQAATKDYV